MTINQSGWKPSSPVQGATDTGTVTGNVVTTTPPVLDTSHPYTR